MQKFSVLIITHAREELLSKCLDSLQFGPDDWQLLLVSNGAELSEEIKLKAQSICREFTLINLPEKQLPGKARNMALDSIFYDWVFLLDDDAYLPSGYIQKVQSVMSHHQLDVLGGPDAPAPGMHAFATSLALTLGSPLCTGSTHVRHLPAKGEMRKASEEQLTSCNLWIKKDLLLSTKFPESFSRAEETMLLLDLQKKDALVYFNPQLYVYHHRRNKMTDLLRPTFNSGFYRSKLMRIQKGSVSSLFWLPAIFTLLHLTFLWNPLAFLEMAKIYTVLIGAISLLIVQRARKVKLFFNVFILHYVIVLFYGLGFIAERMGYPWKSPQ